jgi:hypothetical protein
VSRRAIPALIVLLAGIAGLVVVAREEPEPTEAVFAAPAGAWMPSVSGAGGLTGTWFCPGVPATADEGVGGEVVVSNRDGEALAGRFTVLTSDGIATGQDFEVAPWSQTTIDVDTYTTTDFASVVVEVDGAGGFVEQRALHPAGDSVAPCSDRTSTEWYLADGFTIDGSIETIILTNPFEESVVADLRFSTESGETSPVAFKGFTVPPQSVKTIRIAELGARDEPIIATAITTTAGRLIVGRAQHYLGGGRLGYDVSLAAPALRDQFWFADGEQGEGITEEYAIYNPTDDDITVDVVLLGLPPEANFGNVAPIEVPAREVVVFDPSRTADGGESNLPDGRHAAVFSTLAEPTIVVERVITRPAGESVATEVLLGAPPSADGYVSNQWHVGIGPAQPTESALVVYNLDQADAAITVSAVGPDGPEPVPSLTDIPVDPGTVALIDLVADAVIGRELIITSTNRIFVERSLSRGSGLDGRSASWALPADLAG